MDRKAGHNSKVDPSAIKQHFTAIQLQVHCCRYWKLKHWEFTNMSFPFWRLYYNTIDGALVRFKDQEVSLSARNVVLIPPHTPFSTRLHAGSHEVLDGSRIESAEELSHLKSKQMIDHLFLHFNLGFQLDHLDPGIYDTPVDQSLKQALDHIRFSIVEQNQIIEYQNAMHIYALLLQLIARIPTDKWKEHHLDTRILRVIDHIDANYAETLSNVELAEIAHMAPNSFLRLFKQATGQTPQSYVQNKRIEKAILSMHNENLSIDDIAEQHGFCDRFNFSKVFKRYVKMSPAAYRKQHTLN